MDINLYLDWISFNLFDFIGLCIFLLIIAVGFVIIVFSFFKR